MGDICITVDLNDLYGGHMILMLFTMFNHYGGLCITVYLNDLYDGHMNICCSQYSLRWRRQTFTKSGKWSERVSVDQIINVGA